MRIVCAFCACQNYVISQVQDIGHQVNKGAMGVGVFVDKAPDAEVPNPSIGRTDRMDRISIKEMTKV